MSTNVAQILRQGALRHPHQVAVIELTADGQHHGQYTFGDLDARAMRTAGHLRACGLGAGATVGLCIENSVDFVSSWFGALYAGCTLVPIPILSAPPEVKARLARAHCRALLCDAAREALAAKACAELDNIQIITPVMLATSTVAEHGPVATSTDTAAMILYTSGTTGLSKGARISHGALLTHTSVLAYHALELGSADRILGVLPLTHSYGCRMVMLSGMYAGACAVLMPRFDPQVAMNAMVDHGITWLPAVPTMLAAFGNLPPGPTPHLRWVMSAGAPLADEVVRRAERRLDAQIRQGYGMTEATIATLNSPPDTRTVGSVGKPVWGVEVKITDEQGLPLPPGTRGEVWLRGHNMMSGYLDDPESTQEAIQDGFMRSGDVGQLDDEGRLYIVDRIKDLIIRGGYNVYPSEVEDVLATHPAIAEVAVVGRPDPLYGEEVVAVVVLRADHKLSAPELIAWSQERVAKPKVPREIRFVAKLPLGPSGKILKRTLKAALASETEADPN